MAKKKTTARKTSAKKPTARKKATPASKAARKKPAAKKSVARKPAAKKTAKKKKKAPSRSSASAEAQRIAQQGESIRERIRDMVVHTVHDRRLDLDELSDVASDVMHGAVEGVKDLRPASRESALRKVVDGLGDAFSRTAGATQLALQEAAGRGKSFAKHDLKRTMKDLGELQDRFVNVLTRATRKAGSEIGGQIDSLNKHIRRTAESVSPSVESALHAAREHPVQLAKETAGAAARSVPRAAGVLLHAMGGLLQDAGRAMARVNERESKRTGKATSKSRKKQ